MANTAGGLEVELGTKVTRDKGGWTGASLDRMQQLSGQNLHPPHFTLATSSSSPEHLS